MGAFDGFMTGFMAVTGKNIGERKQEAKDYFDKKMELAFEAAQTFRTQNKEKMDGALQIANQLKQIGVPNDVVMAITNQNPDDLGTFYKTIQDMQMKGVKFNEQTFRDMIQVDQEFNQGDGNVTGLLQKIYRPLVGNVAANPEAFEFDPKGTIWATMMGYNAMERANQKLATTEVIPGITAAEALAATDSPNLSPMGQHPVTFNAPLAGQAIDDAKGTDEPSVSETRAVFDTFNDLATEYAVSNPEVIKLTKRDERRKKAEELAAIQTARMFPNFVGMPQFGTIFDNLPNLDTGEESLTDAPTAAPASPATTPPEQATPATSEAPTASQPIVQEDAPPLLPDGSKFVKVLPDGTLAYVSTTGQKFRYTKSFVDMIMQGQAEMNRTAPPPDAWSRPLGS